MQADEELPPVGILKKQDRALKHESGLMTHIRYLDGGNTWQDHLNR